jgi:hypothetical protein
MEVKRNEIDPLTTTWLSDILAERRLQILQAVLSAYPTIIPSTMTLKYNLNVSAQPISVGKNVTEDEEETKTKTKTKAKKVKKEAKTKAEA